MDAVLSPGVQEIVLMTASQVGKSSLINNVIAYFAVVEPSPIMFMLPTLDLAKNYSTTRIDTLIRDSPIVDSVFPPYEGNTVLQKRFPGGHLTLVGANSPVMLSSQPIRVLLADEVDRFPKSVGSEGDPLDLARKRTNNFTDRKIIITSTPTVTGESAIEVAYEQSDQRKYYVPCLHCGEFQTLVWANVLWEKDKPETAHYVCSGCGVVLEDSDKPEMLAQGEWRAGRPFIGRAGFHLNELYSPWRTYGEIATVFLEAKKKTEKLRVFVNTSLAETFEERGEGIDEKDVSSRVEQYNAEVPAAVLCLVAGVDVQVDRVEIEVWGVGLDEENWSIVYKTIYGDPAEKKIYAELLDYLTRDFVQDQNALPIRIDATAIDSGGLYTDQVYEFCREHKGNRIFSVKGNAVAGKPIVARPIRSGVHGTLVYLVGTDTAKDVIYARLKIQDKGPGYCHFPVGRDPEYFKQLTSERTIRKFVRGYAKRQYVKVYERNEALDCRVYALAALTLLNPDWRILQRRRAGARIDLPESEPVADVIVEKKGLSVLPNRSSGFVSKYRKLMR